MEQYLLKSPLCYEDTLNIQKSLGSVNKLLDSSCVQPISEDTCVDFECGNLVDFSVSNKNVQFQALSSGKKDSSGTSRRRKRLVATSSSTQRSSTIEDTKDNDKLPTNNVKLDFLEMGEKGLLCEMFTTNLQDWLEFGCTLSTPAVKKHKVMLTSRHLTNITIKELQLIIYHLSRENAKAFSSMPLEGEQSKEIYIPYNSASLAHKCIIISRNFEQWKACVDFNGSVDFPDLFNNNALKHMQKFSPSVTANNVFIPRQKIFWAIIESDHVSN